MSGTMSVRDALPGEVYVDGGGKLWRVIAICHEPTVQMREIEPRLYAGISGRLSGGVSGLMWDGFCRIYRHASVEAGG